MLQDYFAIGITPDSITIPQLIPNFNPEENIQKAINNLVVEIVNSIDWNNERKSFASIMHIIAAIWDFSSKRRAFKVHI